MKRYVIISLLVFLLFYVHISLVTAQTLTNAITLGQMNLTATFNSIGIELFFTGDDNANAKATLEFKKSTDSAWRKGLELWRTDDGSTTPGRAFYGSALLLNQNTSYDIKVTVTDADGGGTTITKSITTRTDNIPPASSLTPTYFVRTDGNDANTGTSNTPSGAWQTVTQAINVAPEGAIVQIGPGHFAVTPSSLIRDTPITLIAQYPAVDNNQNQINIGQHSIIENSQVSAPTDNAWKQVTLTGPHTGQQFTVWKWSSGYGGAGYLGYAATKDALPNRLPNWKPVPDNETPAHWVEKIYMNTTFHYGWWEDPSHPGNIYVRMWGDTNPNNYFMTLGEGNIFEFRSNNVRVSGLELRGARTAIYLDQTASQTVIDHNLFDAWDTGVFFSSDDGSTYGSDDIVQNNLFVDSNQWSPDPVNQPAISFNWLKGGIDSPIWNGVQTNWYANDEHDGENDETTPLFGQGSKRLTVRYNTFNQFWDALSTYCSNCDRYMFQDLDFHDNLLEYNPDDGIEISGGDTINWRIWNNHFNYTGTVLAFSSPGIIFGGPIYLFRNTAYMTGTKGIGLPRDGMEGTYFKYSERDETQARVYVINNTFWSNDATLTSTGEQQAIAGACDCTTGANSQNQYVQAGFYLRNNIIAATDVAFHVSIPLNYDEDYNYFYTTSNWAGIEYNGEHHQDLAGYQQVSGMGLHDNYTNLSTKAQTPNFDSAPPDLTNPAAGDLRLTATSPQINAGTIVPNIADNSDIQTTYTGSAPDLGATEYGLNTITPSPTSTLSNGDANGDGVVNIADITTVLQNWLKNMTGTVDQFADGTINSLDFTQVILHLP